VTVSPIRGHLPQFDLLRGAAIIAVVYLHAYFTPWPEVSGEGLTALRLVHLVAHTAVPVFLFIAALLQGMGERESVAEHLRRRLWNTWVPAVAWMFAAFAYRGATDGVSAALLRDLALFNIAGQFYFIWLILVFGVALSQGWRIPESRLPFLAAAALAISLATVLLYEGRGTGGSLSTILAYRNPLLWLFFPVLGYSLGRRGVIAPPARVVAGGALVLAAAASAYAWAGIRGDYWPVSYFGFAVFVFSAGAMFVYPAAARAMLTARLAARPLIALARYAYPIYLVHIPFVMGFATHELLGEGSSWSNYWLLLHANAAIGLFVSLALVREIDKLSPWLGRFVLGVRRPKRVRARPASPTRRAA